MQLFESPARRRRRSNVFDSRLLRLGCAVALAATIWSYGLVGFEKRVLIAARWVADHTGATWASEVWRSTGQPKVEHALTTGYQDLRQSTVTAIEHVDVGAPAERAVENLGKAVDAAEPDVPTENEGRSRHNRRVRPTEQRAEPRPTSGR
jgi:hypothetical protein